MTDSGDSDADTISLTQVDAQRQESEKRTRDGQSGAALYQIKFHNGDDKIVQAKSTEIGRIAESDRMDLEAIQAEDYTHYGVFRLEDRSTVTIIQNESKELFKIFSLGRNTVKIAHRVTITEAPK